MLNMSVKEALNLKQEKIMNTILDYGKKLVDQKIYGNDFRDNDNLKNLTLTKLDVLDSINLNDFNNDIEQHTLFYIIALEYMKSTGLEKQLVNHVFQHLDNIISGDDEYDPEIDDIFFITSQIEKINDFKEKGFDGKKLYQALLIDEEVPALNTATKILNPCYTSKKLNALRIMAAQGYDISIGLDEEVKEPQLIIALTKGKSLGVDDRILKEIKEIDNDSMIDKISTLSGSRSKEEFESKFKNIRGRER